MKNKRYLAYLAILMAVVTGVAVWLTGFTRDEPSIKFLEFRANPNGSRTAVFRMSNPTARYYTYKVYEKTPYFGWRCQTPAGWETVIGTGTCLGGITYCELAPHSASDFEIPGLPDWSKFAIAIYFLPGTTAENASKRGGIPFYRNLPKFIRQLIPEQQPTWSDSVRLPAQ